VDPGNSVREEHRVIHCTTNKVQNLEIVLSDNRSLSPASLENAEDSEKKKAMLFVDSENSVREEH
jgi:hypothetical protein